MGGNGVLSGTGFVRKPALDKSTRAVETIEYAHHEIHGGRGFHAFYANTSVADNARHVLSFRTPNTSRWIHMLAEVESTGEAEFLVYEDAQVTVNTGTSRPVYNRNRNSGNASEIIDTGSGAGGGTANQITLNGSFGSGSAYGTPIDHIVLGAGKKVGGEFRGTAEWVLAPNTLYAFSFVSRAASNIMYIHLDWYEHIDKDLSTNG